MPDPAVSYPSAVQRIQTILDGEKSQPDLAFPSEALLHGGKTERALLIFHGITNSPEQFRPMGEMFHERGYNVFIPRHPRHGYKDRTGEALRGYTLEEGLEYAGRAVDITCGLGERITVMGLSGGGNLTIWLAHARREIDQAVVIAPALGGPGIPAWATGLTLALTRLLPDMHMWWDPRTKMMNPASPPFAYTGYMSRAMGQIGHLGQQAKQLAAQTPPLARRILLITNANDLAVNKEEIEQLRKLWAGYPGFQAYEIPAEAGVEHDFISLDLNATANRALYPRLVELIIANQA